MRDRDGWRELARKHHEWAKLTSDSPCRWHREHRGKMTETPCGEARWIVWVRWVCECGKATHWYQDEHRADRDRDRHACDGQQRLPL